MLQLILLRALDVILCCTERELPLRGHDEHLVVQPMATSWNFSNS